MTQNEVEKKINRVLAGLSSGADAEVILAWIVDATIAVLICEEIPPMTRFAMYNGLAQVAYGYSALVAWDQWVTSDFHTKLESNL